jgi:hypothetical protein
LGAAVDFGWLYMPELDFGAKRQIRGDCNAFIMFHHSLELNSTATAAPHLQQILQRAKCFVLTHTQAHAATACTAGKAAASYTSASGV